MGKLDDAFQIYRVYLGIVRHFASGSTYDYVLYNGAVRASQESFDKRRDRMMFVNLAGRLQVAEAVGFFVANTVAQNETLWIGELLDSECFAIYERWRGRVASAAHHFEADIKTLIRDSGCRDVLDWIRSSSGPHPFVVREILDERITPETFVTLMKILDAWVLTDQNTQDTILWPKRSVTLYKYGSFLDVPLRSRAAKLRELLTSPAGSSVT